MPDHRDTINKLVDVERKSEWKSLGDTLNDIERAGSQPKPKRDEEEPDSEPDGSDDEK